MWSYSKCSEPHEHSCSGWPSNGSGTLEPQPRHLYTMYFIQTQRATYSSLASCGLHLVLRDMSHRRTNLCRVCTGARGAPSTNHPSAHYRGDSRWCVALVLYRQRVLCYPYKMLYPDTLKYCVPLRLVELQSAFSWACLVLVL